MRFRRALIVPLFTWLACLHASRSSSFDGTGAEGGRRELCADHSWRAVRVEGELARVVHETLHRSPTFRRQLATIVSEGTLFITLGHCLGRVSKARAQTVLTSDGGLLRQAEIRVKPLDTLGPVQVIAHELEHILERLDGVDLPRVAAEEGHPRHGVHRTVDGFYETQRASRVGLAVAAEFVARAGARFSCSSVQ